MLALLGVVSLVSAMLLTFTARRASAEPSGWVGVDKSASPNTSDRCPNAQSIIKWTPITVNGSRDTDAGSGNPDNNFHLDYKYDPVTRLLHIYNVYFQDTANSPVYPVSYSLVLIQQPGGAESTDWSGPLQPGLSTKTNGETFRYDLPGDATFTNAKTPQYVFLCVSTNYFFVKKVTSPIAVGQA